MSKIMETTTKHPQKTPLLSDYEYLPGPQPALIINLGKCCDMLRHCNTCFVKKLSAFRLPGNNSIHAVESAENVW